MSSQNTHKNTLPRATTYTKVPKPPRFTLPIFKLPLTLYRAGLGWILGHRFMLLIHIGRRSGKVRRTVLAVLKFDPNTREIKGISAWSTSGMNRARSFFSIRHPAVKTQ